MATVTAHVEVAFSEEGDRTRADALLELGGEHFHGYGQARRAPADPSVPVVGEELAAARALSDLSHKLLDAAAERIDRF
ncbi:MAG: dsRBD fold-containing protein [Solirubrobacteraceae bacterium]